VKENLSEWSLVRVKDSSGLVCIWCFTGSYQDSRQVVGIQVIMCIVMHDVFLGLFLLLAASFHVFDTKLKGRS
jgi:hypothetical protein